MRFAIQVNGHPGSSQAADTAYQFIKAALAGNHEIMLVFFYHDGVLNGLASLGASMGEEGSAVRWSQLAREFGLDLVVCVSAAGRRGLPQPVTSSSASGGLSLAAGFRAGGLGQWVHACLHCDRFITFAA
jgi:tRNA 2-thiouridine synthesizing protein D